MKVNWYAGGRWPENLCRYLSRLCGEVDLTSLFLNM
jgi:hypothetical protein